MFNPVREARQARGLSMKQFAQVLGVPYSAVSGVENGMYTKFPSTWQKGMTRLGMDYEAMQAAYTDWRSRLADAITEGM